MFLSQNGRGMTKAKVLVCRTTGFIGRNLTEKLALYSKFEVYAARFRRPEYDLLNVK